METSNTTIHELINQLDDFKYGIYTYDGMIEDADSEFAVNLYNSDGVFCLTRSSKSFETMPSFEVLLGYKFNLPFPADIHHLQMIRNAVLSAEFCAEHSYGDDYYEQKFKEDLHLYAEEFGAYYHLYPDLIDDNRQKIIELLKLLRQHWQSLQVKDYIEACEKIRELIDPLLAGFTKGGIDRFYSVLDLSKFNPKQPNA